MLPITKMCIRDRILDDAVHVLLTLAGRVGVVQTQVELTAVLVCNGPVDVDGLGTADVQVAVGLGREAGMDLADLALGQIDVYKRQPAIWAFWTLPPSAS